MTDVWITRTEPGASRTAERVRALGLTPIVAPLLVTRAVEVPPPDPDESVAFTSPNGVRFYDGPTDRTAWCVGEATADAARAKGFKDIRVGGVDVADLAARLTYELDGPLVHWSGAHVAGDLLGALTEAGKTVRRVVAYVAEPVDVSPVTQRVDIVLLHSPRAAETYSRLSAFTADVALVLSPRVEAAMRPGDVRAVYFPTLPTEDGLMIALEQMPGVLAGSES